MKKYSLICMAIVLCLICPAAFALPAVTDGETTGWIAENNYLFLQSANGQIAQLSLAIDDLIGMTKDELICRAGNQQTIAVRKNGTGSRLVEPAEADTLQYTQIRIENEALVLNGQPISASAVSAVTDGIYLYTVEKVGLTAFALRVNALQPEGKLIQSRSRDAYALAFSGKAVTDTLNMTVTKEALTLTGTDHAVTVMNLLTGEILQYPATSDETAAAVLQGGTLYRYLFTDEQRWVLESATAVTTPTPVPSPTPTPKPTDKGGQTDDNGTIYYGAYNNTVRKIQTRLSELGYPIWKIDGKYGDETQLAINLFCDAIHVREHRYITRKIQKKLFAQDAPFYDPYLPLKKGDQGVSVLYMQTRLKELGYDPGKLDGIYGKNTVAAVALFQADHGIALEEKEKPGEVASREMLELLYAPEPEPIPPDPTPTVSPDPATPTDL